MRARLPSLTDPLVPSAEEIERGEAVAAGRAERAQVLRSHLHRREEQTRRTAEAEDFAEHFRRSISTA
jgi:hypothetical protein